MLFFLLAILCLLAPCCVCMSLVLWVDVQTGCVWAGVPLFVPLSAALILGFVCSIWAKFSNGDNNRGRLGEWRRWVPPLYCVSCMLLQASQVHLPVPPHLNHPTRVTEDPLEHWVCPLTISPITVTVAPITNCHFTPLQPSTVYR